MHLICALSPSHHPLRVHFTIPSPTEGSLRHPFIHWVLTSPSHHPLRGHFKIPSRTESYLHHPFTHWGFTSPSLHPLRVHFTILVPTEGSLHHPFTHSRVLMGPRRGVLVYGERGYEWGETFHSFNELGVGWGWSWRALPLVSISCARCATCGAAVALHSKPLSNQTQCSVACWPIYIFRVHFL